MVNVVTSNVVIQQIGNVLNDNGGNVDVNRPLTFFTAAANINKWAKYKPQKHKNDIKLSEHERKLGNYGLNVNYFNTKTPQTVLIDASNGVDFYPYQLPTGGVDSPYRLSDFCGYNADANPPYKLNCSDTLNPQTFPAFISYTVLFNGGEFELTDLASFEDVAKNSNIYILLSDGLQHNSMVHAYKPTVNNNMMYGEIPVNNSGTYYLCAAYANGSYSDGEDISGVADNFVPIPDGYTKVVVTQKVIYGSVTVSNFLDSHTPYYSNGYINNFSSYPMFNIVANYGAISSSSYRFGLYFQITIDGQQYDTEWYYTGETIDCPALSSNESKSIQFSDFPTYLTMEEIMKGQWDSSMENNVNSIKIRYTLEKVSGQGFLFIPNTTEYQVTIS